jgi:hypothetical protein
VSQHTVGASDDGVCWPRGRKTPAPERQLAFSERGSQPSWNEGLPDQLTAWRMVVISLARIEAHLEGRAGRIAE